jgi:hypothetical protein
MALIDEVKKICDRLAPFGWQKLLLDVTDGKLDIQPKTGSLKAALTRELGGGIDRGIPGFQDFDLAGKHGITAGKPSQSLLYHALASPCVVRDAGSKMLREFPTMKEIEAVENFVFGVQPPTLDEIRQRANGGQLAVVVYATEYRSGLDTAHGEYADLTFSRTGIARVGTARPKYWGNVRGFWPEDEDNGTISASFRCASPLGLPPRSRATMRR